MYATVQDFIDRFGEDEALELSRLGDPSVEVVDEVLILGRLDDASAILNSYIGREILIPAPAVVVQKVCEIGRALLDRNRRRDDVQADYDAAIAWCRDAAKGLVKLPERKADSVLPTPGSTYAVEPDFGRQEAFYARY